jgi:ATP-binding protein involved in chromosome partitioning
MTERSLDPRLQIVERRLAGIGRIVAVSGGKGGIGKSSVASGLALALARRDSRVGLLDLDFCGPSTHVILGIHDARPTEQGGLLPAVVHGIRYLSIVPFIDDRPAPLRGGDISNVMIELLAITQWGDLDALVIDMPPGFSDPLLDTARLLRRAQYLVVATPSVVTLETVRKALRVLQALGLPVLGIVENLRRGDERPLGEQLGEYGVPVLASIPYEAAFEAAVGDVTRLAQTVFMRHMEGLAEAIRGS